MKAIEGGCLCGNVRYKIIQKPLSQGICYCQQCQKLGGTFGTPLMVLPGNAFECVGEELNSFETTSDRGSIVTRNFCTKCATHIFAKISDISNLVTVRAATLDDISFFKPEYMVWTQHAAFENPQAGVASFKESAPLELVIPS